MQGSTSDQILTRVCNTAQPIMPGVTDHAGFLRCKTSVLKSCVLSYAPSEIADKKMPAPLRLRKEVRLFVPEDELAKDGALDSLEGRPISVDHYWQSTLGTNDVGNVAGKPIYDSESKTLFADILITDPVAIQRITADPADALKLVEQSAAYLMQIDWTHGFTEDGEEYDGIQRDIQFNHVALVGEGEGRAGSDIRILNKKGKQMVDNEYTQMKMWGETIRVLNSDVTKVENAIDEKDKTMSQLVDPEKLEALSNELATSRDEVAAKNADIDAKTGELSVLQEKIKELMNPEEKEKALNKLINDRESAQRIYNSLKGNSDSKELQEASEKAKILQGHALYSDVVSSVRALNKKEPLSAAQLENQDMVGGMFFAIADISSMPAAKTVAGADMTIAMNSNPAKVVHLSQAERRSLNASKYNVKR